jgi:hypothetical protein
MFLFRELVVRQLSENERMERGDHLRDRAKDERAEEKAQTERLRFCEEYHEITGKELPEYIQKMPLDRLRLAICAARNGIVFGELKPPKSAENSSLLDWDNQDAKNGNAYGS